MPYDVRMRALVSLPLLLSLSCWGLARAQEPCPPPCECIGTIIACSGKGLKRIPSSLPSYSQRIDLQGNDLTEITAGDLRRLSDLRIINLQQNHIARIEDGAFDNLPKLQRIRLNRNRLTILPENLFAKNPSLVRIDLSFNDLTSVPRNVFTGLTQLVNLQFDHNSLRCLPGANTWLRANKYSLRFLTLSHNKLVQLPSAIAKLNNVKKLHVSDNPLHCDCSVTRLKGFYSKKSAELGAPPRCVSPSHLAGKLITELPPQVYNCTLTPPIGSACFTRRAAKDRKGQKEMRDQPQSMFLAQKSNCPIGCSCLTSVVKCQGSAVTLQSLADLPREVKVLRVSGATIPTLTDGGLQNLPSLDVLEISASGLVIIEDGAFKGQRELKELLLYGNKLQQLPLGIFRSLSQLRSLYLNSNQLRCIGEGVFEGLLKITTLSLYDNKISTLTGTSLPLNTLSTIHLGQNKLVCDCNLAWLSELLKQKPMLEQTAVSCAAPVRMRGKSIARHNVAKFQCRNDMESLRTRLPCGVEPECPAGCICSSTAVVCRSLGAWPQRIPSYTKVLKLIGGRISSVPQHLPNLEDLEELSLEDNEVETLPQQLLDHYPTLRKLSLAKNKLTQLDGLKSNSIVELDVSGNQLKCFRNSTITGLTALQKLDLTVNQLTCVQPLRTSLRVMLAENPLSCDCHLHWLTGNSNVDGARCHTPVGLLERSLTTLSAADLTCSSQRTCGGELLSTQPCCRDPDTQDPMIMANIMCDRPDTCPTNCTCNAMEAKVVCYNAGLTSIPTDVPADTRELKMAGNSITQLPKWLGRLTQLEKLDLSNNKLDFLPADSFGALSQLRVLLLGSNNLRCIHSRAFSGLERLRILSLPNNDLSSVPHGTFDLANLAQLVLSNNPLYCDCELKWLAVQVQKTYVEGGMAKCVGPDSMRGRTLLSPPEEMFVCDKPTPEAVKEKCNLCKNSPCQNGGTCLSSNYPDFHCQCQPGYQGQYCEQKIDACYGAPCRNGGTCIADGEFGQFSCVCLPGFTGNRCDTNDNDCVGNICENNSTCIDGINSYTCRCSPMYSGQFCTKRLHICSPELNPCRHGAQCTALSADSGYKCQCVDGWSGRNCSELVQDQMLADKVGRTACTDHECQNGGVCVPSEYTSGYDCRCKAGNSGKRCEKLYSASFTGDGWLRLPPLPPPVDDSAEVNVSIVMVTDQPEGLVFAAGDATDQLRLELYQGYLKLSSSGASSIVFSLTPVNATRPYALVLNVRRSTARFQMDGGLWNTIRIAEGGSGSLLSRAPLQLAGIEGDTSRRGLTGCLLKLYINSSPVNFVEVESKGLSPGCTVIDNANCHNHNCQNGATCRSLVQGYTCDCQPGYSGKKCEVAPSCTGTAKKEQYKDAQGCVSRKALKHRVCGGSCGEACCRPSKIKVRRVRLRCPDGTSYVKKIPVVKRCGCKECSVASTRLKRVSFWDY